VYDLATLSHALCSLLSQISPMPGHAALWCPYASGVWGRKWCCESVHIISQLPQICHRFTMRASLLTPELQLMETFDTAVDCTYNGRQGVETAVRPS
jgi:hypothetical protein